MSECFCGSQIEYNACCGLYHQGEKTAPTPEALMRSRYSAYVLGNAAYIQKTMRDKASFGFNLHEVDAWAKSVQWLGLEVSAVKHVSPELGYVEFIAYFIEGGQKRSICEISEFRFMDGQWFYVDGMHPSATIKSNAEKVGRNTPCPCGSQKKFKYCHGK